MNEHSPDLESLRRWWARLPLEHPFVIVIRQLTGDLPRPDDPRDPLTWRSRPPSTRSPNRRTKGPKTS